MGKQAAGAAGNYENLIEAFKRLSGFEVELLFSKEPLSIETRLPIQKTYYLSGAKFPWLHVGLKKIDRDLFKFWEFACKPCEFISSFTPQYAAGWLVEITRRVERCEIQNCRQSAIDPDDIYRLLRRETPTFSKMVGYSIPNLTEAAIELVEIVSKEMASTDWTKCLDRDGKFIIWGNERFDTLTPKIIELLAIMLKKYPEPVALAGFGVHAPNTECNEAFSKLWRVKRGKNVDGERNPAVPHDVWQIVREAARGMYTLVDPKRVTRIKKRQSTREKAGQTKQIKSPTKSTTGTR